MSVLVQRLGLSSTTSSTKWTFSAWVKRSRNVSSASEFIFSSNNERTSGSNYSSIFFQNDLLTYYDYYNGGSQVLLRTNRLFRDVNAWYHIVVRYDSTLSTADDRIRFYVNGTQETSMESRSNVAQNDGSFLNRSGYDNFLGTQTNNLSGHFLGSMSHVHLADGQSYAPTVFGETDSTTGEWKINTAPSVTYGTNGFFILKDGNSVTDQSGNTNNFSVGSGTLTKTEDCPSNVFATFNPLATFANITLTNGNNTYTLNAGTWESTPSTLAVPSSGKYYAEFKWNASSTTAQYMMVGVDAPRLFTHWGTQYPGNSAVGYAYGWDGDKRNNGSQTSYGDAWSATSIIGVAIDMDNKKLYFHKDGVYQNSGVPTSGSTGTGALSLTEDEYYLIVSGYKNTENPSIHANFGNGYFGTTAVATQGTNASGNGIFEFDVPTGYTALSTKGLNL